MASINGITMENTQMALNKQKRILFYTDIYLDDECIGFLSDNKVITFDPQCESDLIARATDYLEHNDLFQHDLVEVNQLSGSLRANKLVMMTLDDLATLTSLEEIFLKKLENGEFSLRTTIDNEFHVFRAKEDFAYKTPDFRKQLLEKQYKERKRKKERGGWMW